MADDGLKTQTHGSHKPIATSSTLSRVPIQESYMGSITVPDLFDHFSPFFRICVRGGCLFLMHLTPPLMVAVAALVEELLVDSDILSAPTRLEEKRSEIRSSCATSVEDLVSTNLLHSTDVLNAMKFLNLLR
ncbi:hypothetical protein L6452_41997 [Arctium lappa]|uniref:Uncharacterized protein n=1 Tax=Arctium lappa TaxID=4217 RepID=A0ACB8XH00_ARCLA|nr:hypothetical protein L6452_41997 [Arctium lappa]